VSKRVFAVAVSGGRFTCSPFTSNDNGASKIVGHKTFGIGALGLQMSFDVPDERVICKTLVMRSAKSVVQVYDNLPTRYGDESVASYALTRFRLLECRSITITIESRAGIDRRAAS
jgi:hypothetical protein